MHIQFAELPVADQDRALTFYTANFGCELVADEVMSEDGWRWIELKLPGSQTNLHFTDRKGAPSANPILVLIEEQVSTAVDALRSAGVEILTEPTQAPYDPNRTVAEFRDSEGNRLVISSS